ncbi:glutamyl-tRNA(Gln) amidotransferase subunit A [Clostridia bacterium]|nr:glutamyl-tRNA(Gln) amidotransferase subunit A [Clostridia bacterium]
MTILEARNALDTHKISVKELTDGYLAAIKSLDGDIHAYLHINEPEAEKAQKRIDAGDAELLTGIPIALKDNLCTADMPTTCASHMLQGYTPPYDATVVKRLRAADAILLGKLNMDEFAMGSTTNTSYFGATRNPYDTTRVPGGSSGGSAAAVAAGLCAAALGSDTGGSIRQPAAFCGVTGHRPTYGLVPRYGCVAFASSLDQVGPLGQNAADCAAVLDTISGACEYDQTSTTAPKIAASANIGMSLKGVKLGVIEEIHNPSIDEAVRWYREAGAVVETVSLPMLKHAIPAYYLISSAEASANLSRFDGVRYGNRAAAVNYEEIITKSRGQGFGKEVKRRILVGSYALCSGYFDAYYLRAIQLANVVREQYNAAFESYDALLSPTTPGTAFKADAPPADPAWMYLADICTVSAPLAGLPSLSTPCGYDENGLPHGLMITGKRWADAQILGLADAFERDFTRRLP